MKLYAACPYLFQILMRPVVYCLLYLFANLEVEGLEHIEKIDDNFILASNHINEFDGFLLPATIPITSHVDPIFPVSRTKDFYADKGIRGKLFYGGYFFNFMGAYPAYAGLQNYQKSLINQEKILQDGYSILIFPEGKVSSNEPKGGVGYLAAATEKPVIPVKINGIGNLGFLGLLMGKCRMKVKFLSPQIYGRDQAKEEDQIDPDKCKTRASQVMQKINDS